MSEQAKLAEAPGTTGMFYIKTRTMVRLGSCFFLGNCCSLALQPCVGVRAVWRGYQLSNLSLGRALRTPSVSGPAAAPLPAHEPLGSPRNAGKIPIPFLFPCFGLSEVRDEPFLLSQDPEVLPQTSPSSSGRSKRPQILFLQISTFQEC